MHTTRPLGSRNLFIDLAKEQYVDCVEPPDLNVRSLNRAQSHCALHEART
jgi:hypothetical protein